MANVEVTLGRPLRNEGQFKEILFASGVIDRADVLKIKAGSLLGIPFVWRLVAARITINTAAPVANRYIMLSHGGLGFYEMGPVAASAAEIYTIGPAIQVVGSAGYTETGGYMGIGPQGMVIQGDDYIGLNIDTNQAGDTWGIRAQFEYLQMSKEQWEKLTIQ